jgi:hypothetical protein
VCIQSFITHYKFSLIVKECNKIEQTTTMFQPKHIHKNSLLKLNADRILWRYSHFVPFGV